MYATRTRRLIRDAEQRDQPRHFSIEHDGKVHVAVQLDKQLIGAEDSDYAELHGAVGISCTSSPTEPNFGAVLYANVSFTCGAFKGLRVGQLIVPGLSGRDPYGAVVRTCGH
jgi:hypothetical protein